MLSKRVCMFAFFFSLFWGPFVTQHGVRGIPSQAADSNPVQNNLGHTKFNKKEGSSETALGPQSGV